MAAAKHERVVDAAADAWRLDATGLIDAYRQGLSPVGVVAECLSRIERLDPSVNAFVALAPDAAARAAESAARIKAGAARPLEGVPIAVKDNLAAAGMPAAWGSKVFAGTTIGEDELPVARLRAAGAIVIGKTNTPEFAVEGYTANDLFGATRNPWRPELTPGGSSGGSVAAVAAGMVPAALGTDGGGSIRRPAAYTGLVGLKPTIGRVARGGGLPQLLLDFEVVGPISRTVRDTRLLYRIMSGPERADPRSRAVAEAAPRQAPLRILHVARFGEAPCDPNICGSVAAAARIFAAMGHHVESAALPFDLDHLNAFWSQIAAVGLARLRRTEPGFHLAGGKYKAMADAGDAVPAADFLAGLQAVEALRRDVSLAFENWDAFLIPACAAMPWRAEDAFPETINGHAVGPRGHAIYTGWVNAAGHPAIALPCDPSTDGMPIGLQLVGDLGAEELLLDLAESFEVARPWADRRPPIAD